MAKTIKGYKVFNPDWTCRGFQYKVGETYEHNGNIEMCGKGFHFCRKAADCFEYYSFDSGNKVAEVEAIGLVETSGDKSVTSKIVIIRELTWHEVLDLVNSGKDCPEWDDTYAALMELAQHRQAVDGGRVVELPCPIGTKIFEADQHMGKVFQRLASKEDMLTKIVSGWGKRYFATPEEAEAALLKEGTE